MFQQNSMFRSFFLKYNFRRRQKKQRRRNLNPNMPVPNGRKVVN